MVVEAESRNRFLESGGCFCCAEDPVSPGNGEVIQVRAAVDESASPGLDIRDDVP